MAGVDQVPKLQSIAGLLLVGSVVAAMVLANSPLAEDYRSVFDTEFEIRLGNAELTKPLILWINDGLMAVFFLLIGLELKRELLQGELSRPGRKALPLIAAFGGIAVPAGIYAALNWKDPVALRGWAIPAATDIAFALGVITALGDRVPRSLKTFLLSLAVFDDLAAILVIAFFYTGGITWAMNALALVAVFVLVAMNRMRVTRLGPYFVVGVILWLCVLKSGVHATLSGVVLGLLIPLRTTDHTGQSPLIHLEHMLQPYVGLLVVPIFAFANAGVNLQGFALSSLLDPVTLGVGGGLLVGKTVGVFGLAAAAIKLGIVRMPEGAGWRSLLGTSVLAGIGFTMSLFIGTLAFAGAGPEYGIGVRVGVLLGSLLSAVIGVLLLLGARRPQPSPAL